MSTAIEINNLTYSYRSDWLYKKISAVKDINLSIEEGESFGFLGPNGAGKTTTIKCILGLVRPATGSIKILGCDSRSPEARKLVGYLPEQPYFYDHLTVQELMMMYAALSGVESNNLKSQVALALSRVKMEGRSGDRMRSLSKGLTQRVAMAQAIVNHPKILILDEPFSGLDPVGRREFKDLILELKEAGTTIFMSSHILSDVEFLCERASITVKGELKGVYNIKELQESRSNDYELVLATGENIESHFINFCKKLYKEQNLLRLTFTDKSSAMEALRKSMELGLDVESFQRQHAGLEEVFVELVSQSR